MPRRVLLTGATGFIGRFMVPHLWSRGFEVHAVTRNDALSVPSPAIRHCADLHKESDRLRIMAECNPTHVMHSAWYVEHGRFWSSPENVRWVETSLALLRCAPAGIRWVGVGTCAEYAWGETGLYSEARTPLEPATLYGSAKHSLRLLQQAAAAAKDISFSWGRIFHLYGPGESEARFVPAVIRGLLQNTSVPLSHGRQIRDWLYVDDVARALVTLLDSSIQGPVNIASGQGTALRSVAETIVAILNKNPELLRFAAVPSATNDPASLVGDPERLSLNRVSARLGSRNRPAAYVCLVGKAFRE